MTTATSWRLQGDILEVCSCNVTCPCNFGGDPTRSPCDAVWGLRIQQGNYGNTRLNNLNVLLYFRIPGKVMEGNWTLGAYLDQRANQQQRDALVQIASGQPGGMPFQVIATLVSKLVGPEFVSFQFNVQGRNSSVRIGNAVAFGFEPVKNPVTGQPENARVEHETGFLFKAAEVVSAKECRAAIGDLNFSWPNKAGFVTQIKYGN